MRATRALVIVEQAGVDGSAEGGQPTSHVYAHFLRANPGMDFDRVAQAIGTSLPTVALGTCSAIAAVDSTVESTVNSTRAYGTHFDAIGTVELADVGRITVEADGQETALAPKAFPDVVDRVSGVVYTTRETLPHLSTGSGRFHFSVTGSNAVGIPPLAFEAQAPALFSSVVVSGEVLSAAAVALPGPRAEIPSPATIPTLPGPSFRDRVGLGWIAGDEADRVFVDLSQADQPGLPQTRCAFADVGHAEIPPGAFRGPGSYRLTLHRIRRVPFTAAGLDVGEARFDVSRAVLVAWRGMEVR